jgi:hypothetical protein
MEMRRLQQPPMPWCVGPGVGKSISPATGTAIGTGYSNTQTIATGSGPYGNDYLPYCTSGAANAAIASTYGGYTDWYVPSADEAKASCWGDSTDYFWTSSEWVNSGQAIVTNCSKTDNRAKDNDFPVSMVRAF